MGSYENSKAQKDKIVERKVNKLLLEIEGYLHPWKQVDFTSEDRKALRKIIKNHLTD